MADYSSGRRLLSWLLTPIFLVATVLTLLAWHPIIVLSRRIAPRFHAWWVCLGNGVLLLHLRLLGARVKFERLSPLPASGPVIVISNHQSFYDIPLLLWGLRERFPRFVAKRELGRGMPSVSYVLREDGSALIDRQDPHQALAAIKGLGRRVKQNNWTACIFPEGTRSRDGVLRRFKPAGLVAILSEAPGVPVVPVSIDGSWELMRYKFWPVPFGVKITVKIHPPLARHGDDKALIEAAEQVVREALPARSSQAPLKIAAKAG